MSVGFCVLKQRSAGPICAFNIFLPYLPASLDPFYVLGIDGSLFWTWVMNPVPYLTYVGTATV